MWESTLTRPLIGNLKVKNSFKMHFLITPPCYRTYCLIGDGESAEGSIWEALHFAGHYHLFVCYLRHQPTGAIRTHISSAQYGSLS